MSQPAEPRASLPSDAMYRDLVEHSPEAVYIVVDGDVAYLNASALRLFRASDASTILGRPILERIHPDDHALALTRRKLVLELGQQAPIVEMRFVALDGTVFEVEIQATRVAIGGRLGTYAVARDISARKRLEEQVRESQKLEAVGRLAGGIAHDFNNTLAVILGHAEMLLGGLPADDPRRQDLEAIHRAAQHSAALTRQLLTYARRQTIAPRPLAVNDEVARALRMLRPLVGENLEVTWLPGSDVWPVVLDPSQLDQILTNLCANARDAIDDVGSITVATANRRLDATAARAIGDLPPGDYVVLSCTDSGRGIPAELLPRLFEPFFTTKPVGSGTGLGLSTVYGIVHQNHGAITVRSAVGAGTRFDVYLPRHLDVGETVPAAESAAGSSQPLPPGGRETILVVEDEPAVLQLTCRALQQRGYTVLAADGPESALQLLAARHDPVDLLLSDVMMPVMSGPDLARIVTAQRRASRVLFMSGFSADLVARHGHLSGDSEIVAKPFTLHELSTRVRAALDRPAA